METRANGKDVAVLLKKLKRLVGIEGDAATKWIADRLGRSVKSPTDISENDVINLDIMIGYFAEDIGVFGER